MHSTDRLISGARMHSRLIALSAAITLAAISAPSCTPGERDTAKTVLDITKIACILANAELTLPSEAATACQIDASLTPAIKQVIDDFKARRLAYARDRMAACKCADPR